MTTAIVAAEKMYHLNTPYRNGLRISPGSRYASTTNARNPATESPSPTGDTHSGQNQPPFIRVLRIVMTKAAMPEILTGSQNHLSSVISIVTLSNLYREARKNINARAASTAIPRIKSTRFASFRLSSGPALGFPPAGRFATAHGVPGSWCLPQIPQYAIGISLGPSCLTIGVQRTRTALAQVAVRWTARLGNLQLTILDSGWVGDLVDECEECNQRDKAKITDQVREEYGSDEVTW